MAKANKTVDGPSDDGDRGNILFRGLWKNQLETIVDIRVTVTGANAYKHQSSSDTASNQSLHMRLPSVGGE
jgi:hypothetical protein